MAAAPARSRRRTNHRRRARRGGSERNLTAAQTPQFGLRKQAVVTSGLIHAQMCFFAMPPPLIVLKNGYAAMPMPMPMPSFRTYKLVFSSSKLRPSVEKTAFAQHVPTFHLPVPTRCIARNSTTLRYPS